MKNGKQKNNILHISRTMDIGGAERIVYQLATDLKDEFDQVHVASTGGLWEEKLAENGDTASSDFGMSIVRIHPLYLLFFLAYLKL